MERAWCSIEECDYPAQFYCECLRLCNEHCSNHIQSELDRSQMPLYVRMKKENIDGLKEIMSTLLKNLIRVEGELLKGTKKTFESCYGKLKNSLKNLSDSVKEFSSKLDDAIEMISIDTKSEMFGDIIRDRGKPFEELKVRVKLPEDRVYNPFYDTLNLLHQPHLKSEGTLNTPKPPIRKTNLALDSLTYPRVRCIPLLSANLKVPLTFRNLLSSEVSPPLLPPIRELNIFHNFI